MPKRLLIAEQWNEFAQKALPENCPAIQRQSMRRAFYAGAHAILFRITTVFNSNTDDVTPSDMEIMKDLHDELLDFAHSILRGAN